MSKEIWERHNYTNHDIGMIINGEIIEYDIKAAGMNLARQFGYIDDKILDHLETLDKQRRNIYLGLMKKNDEQLVRMKIKLLSKLVGYLLFQTS
jgi:DNA-binding MltR family transcriptional regulator